VTEYHQATPRHTWLAPAVGVGVVICALLTATIAVGLPRSSAGAGDDYWMPPDGHRAAWASSASPDVKYVEWSRPGPLTLLQSNLTGFAYWLSVTHVSVASAQFAHLNVLQADPAGVSDVQTDDVWTLGEAGAQAVIENEVDITGEEAEISIAVMEPGRLDLPAGLKAGDRWTSKGTAHVWDAAQNAIVQEPYTADFQAAAAPDAGAGCLAVTMTQVTGDSSKTDIRTWCPGQGIVALSRDAGAWTPTAARQPATLTPEQPFNWSAAAQLAFSPLTVNQSGLAGPMTLAPLSAPGLASDRAVFVTQLPPVAVGVDLTGDEPSVASSASPGGTPTAFALMGGLTVVATTNRQVVAYNEDMRWVWQADLSDLAVVSPVRFGDKVVVALLDGSVTAFDLASGQMAWRVDLGSEIRFAPVVAGDRALVATQSGRLTCLDETGQVVWDQDVGVPLSLAVSAGPDPVVVYGADNSVVLRGYSLADGHQVWRNRVYQSARDLVALDSVVVLRDNDATLGIDWKTGAVSWRWSGQRTAAAIGGGQSVLLLGDTDLVLLGADGQPVRSWPHGIDQVSDHTSYMVAAGGTVLVYCGSTMRLGVLG